MNATTKLGAYTLGLLAVFGTAAGIGNAVGPIGSADSENTHGTGTHAGNGTGTAGTGGESATVAGGGAHGGEHGGEPAPGNTLPGGLLTSQDGYTLQLDRTALPAGEDTAVTFRIAGPDGQPLTAYDASHDEDLHLIAVRRDLAGFQHVHPELRADGTWTTPLDLTPGTWRLFADFDPAGDDAALTLGTDVAVGGEYVPRPLPEPSATAEVDGYTVTLDGQLVPGQESELTLSVSRDGEPVTDLQPYLAAYGHLVALRDGDLAYLHVHPAGAPGDGVTQPGPDITFYATAPSAGDYRLFLDFQHGDVVRTAEFTARAGDPAAVPTAGTGHAADGHSHG